MVKVSSLLDSCCQCRYLKPCDSHAHKSSPTGVIRPPLKELLTSDSMSTVHLGFHAEPDVPDWKCSYRQCSREGPHLHESSGLLRPGAISDSMSAVPLGFRRYCFARDAPCTEDQPLMSSTLFPKYMRPLRTDMSLSWVRVTPA